MIDGIPLIGLTAPTLLGLAVLLLLTGRLVPRSTLMDKAREADQWRKAYEAEREARAALDAHATELLEVAKTTQAFITAVFENSERIRQTGGPNEASRST